MSKDTKPTDNIKMVSAKIFRDEDGNLYRKLKATEALKAKEMVRGEVGDGDKAKPAFFEPVRG